MTTSAILVTALSQRQPRQTYHPVQIAELRPSDRVFSLMPVLSPPQAELDLVWARHMGELGWHMALTSADGGLTVTLRK